MTNTATGFCSYIGAGVSTCFLHRASALRLRHCLPASSSTAFCLKVCRGRCTALAGGAGGGWSRETSPRVSQRQAVSADAIPGDLAQ